MRIGTTDRAGKPTDIFEKAPKIVKRQDAPSRGESKVEGRSLFSARGVAARPTLFDPLQPFHQSLGNRALGEFIQAKLKVSQPGDQYEQDADRVAEQVMRMPDEAPEQASVSRLVSP